MKYPSSYSLLITGIVMTIGTLSKLLGFIHIDSDWFWFLAGVGLIIQGMTTIHKQKKFEKKYKIIPRKNN